MVVSLKFMTLFCEESFNGRGFKIHDMTLFCGESFNGRGFKIHDTVLWEKF